MGRRNHHHVVSRGYQRFFADGERVQLCEVRPSESTKRIRSAGTRDVFVKKDFSSFRNQDGDLVDPIEDRWRELEDTALPVVAHWIKTGEPGFVDRELKVLGALHAARSYAFHDLHTTIAVSQRRSAVNADRVQRLGLAYLDQYGREAAPGEVEEAILEIFDAQWGPNGFARIQAMVTIYNEALEWLAPKYIRPLIITRPVPHQFILGDNSLISFCHHGLDLRPGLNHGLPLREGHTIFMPVHPKVAVEFNDEEHQGGEVPPWEVQRLNWITWRAAHRQVVAHPSADLERCLATRLLP